MSIRDFTVTLSDSDWEANPATVNVAGVEGEHKATKIKFILPEEYSNSFRYQIEYDNGAGVGGCSPELTIATVGGNRIVEWDLPQSVTELGTAFISLKMFTVENEDYTLIAKSAPVRMIFKPGRKFSSAIKEAFTNALESLYARVSALISRIESGEFKGEDATINGHTAVTLIGGSNITLVDNEGTITANVTMPSWDQVTGKPTHFTPYEHYHSVEYITNSHGHTFPAGLYPSYGQETLIYILDNYGQSIAQLSTTKQSTGITDSGSRFTTDTVEGALEQLGEEIDDLSETVSGISTDWSDITGKPASFTPSAHTHTVAQVTGAAKSTEQLVAEFDAEITIGSLGGDPLRANAMDGVEITAEEGATLWAWLEAGGGMPYEISTDNYEMLYCNPDYFGTGSALLIGNTQGIYYAIPRAGGIIEDQDEYLGRKIAREVDITTATEEVYNNCQPKTQTVTLTAPSIITLADNTEYRLTNVSNLTITYPQGNFEAWIKLATAASGTVTITLPSSSYIGDTPTFDAGETWEISIKDGVVIAQKVVAAS